MPEYRTPGVYVEEISAGTRPIAASSTADTGFVGILTIPSSFFAGTGKATGLFVPGTSETARLQWNRALAFGPLQAAKTIAAPAAAPKKDAKGKPIAATPVKAVNDLQGLVNTILDGSWSIGAPDGSAKVTLKSTKGQVFQFPVQPALMSVVVNESGKKEWDLAWGANQDQLIRIISNNAVGLGITHSGAIGCADPKQSISLKVGDIQEALQTEAIALNNVDDYHSWRADYGSRLFVEIASMANNLPVEQAEVMWDTMAPEAKAAWDDWLRRHPGLLRIEIGLTGFFTNGGKTAWLTIGLQEDGGAGIGKHKFLADSYDGVSNVAMLVAPGLGFDWQQAILEYAGPSGRKDLFAVLETPRYFLTKAPRGTKLSQFRWIEDDSPYEMDVFDGLPTPVCSELRFQGFASDTILDRVIPRDDVGHGAAYGPWLVVENPVSTGSKDRYLIVPPGGHVAGVIAATDNKAGGGVHKAPANEQMLGCADLVTQVSDAEQGALNPKGLNMIRHRPGAGIRIWGARTVASDPLWNYINVRRMFLFVERSVRDAVTWAVFLPNNKHTRLDLKNTISVFLYTCYQQRMLDGDTWKDGFTVQCDNANNPDSDVRAGLLTVDISLRPVFPAEFIRLRFQQSAIRSDAAE